MITMEPRRRDARTEQGTRRTEPQGLTVWRCPSCRTILAKLALTNGSRVEIKCAKCNTYAVLEAA